MPVALPRTRGYYFQVRRRSIAITPDPTLGMKWKELAVNRMLLVIKRRAKVPQSVQTAAQANRVVKCESGRKPSDSRTYDRDLLSIRVPFQDQLLPKVNRTSTNLKPMLVNGEVGLVWTPGGRVFRVLRFSLADGKILTVDVIADPARLREFDLAVLDE